MGSNHDHEVPSYSRLIESENSAMINTTALVPDLQNMNAGGLLSCFASHFAGRYRCYTVGGYTVGGTWLYNTKFASRKRECLKYNLTPDFSNIQGVSKRMS